MNISIVIAGFAISLLVYISLQTIVRGILNLEHISVQQNTRGGQQEKKVRPHVQAKWLFVYSRFLFSGLAELWKARIRKACFKMESLARGSRAYKLASKLPRQKTWGGKSGEGRPN